MAIEINAYGGETDARLRTRLQDFELQFRYPLGEDFFRIDHGADYLSFFRTLGEPQLFVAHSGADIAGVLVAVRRRIPETAWYLGDLKVAKRFGATLTSLRLLEAFEGVARGAPAYGISMDPARGSNRVAKMLMRSPRTRLTSPCRLVFFSLSFENWKHVEAAVKREFGPIGFLSHAGRKDIVLESTGAPMPLLHLQHGAVGRLEGTAREGSEHMFCVPDGHALHRHVVQCGIDIAATATVVQRHLQSQDWTFVLTSDI